jgi:hypothetical protein
MKQHSPGGGDAGFSEFLATLPAEFFNDAPVGLPREAAAAGAGDGDGPHDDAHGDD